MVVVPPCTLLRAKWDGGRQGMGRSQAQAVMRGSMLTDRVQALLREALTWPGDERADVAAELLAGLDHSTEDLAAVHTAWVSRHFSHAHLNCSLTSIATPFVEVSKADEGGRFTR